MPNAWYHHIFDFVSVYCISTKNQVRLGDLQEILYVYVTVGPKEMLHNVCANNIQLIRYLLRYIELLSRVS